MGGLVVVIVLAVLIIVVSRRPRSSCRSRVPTSSNVSVNTAAPCKRGFHILDSLPRCRSVQAFFKGTGHRHTPQVCITRDNVQVSVDGVLYLKVLNPERASYGIADYNFGISQLAQTTLRSEFGKIELDRTFEERTNINTQVVSELDKASEPWGIKVMRYEIKNITPPHDVLAAMEKQMRAEREKRAVILTSEGQRDAAINNAEGEKQQVIKASEARSSSKSTKQRAKRRRFSPSPKRQPTAYAKSPTPSNSRADSKRSSCASRKTISHSSANSPRKATR